MMMTLSFRCYCRELRRHYVVVLRPPVSIRERAFWTASDPIWLGPWPPWADMHASSNHPCHLSACSERAWNSRCTRRREERRRRLAHVWTNATLPICPLRTIPTPTEATWGESCRWSPACPPCYSFSLALCVVDELKNKRKRNHKHKRWRRFGGHSRHGIKVICLNKNLVSFKKIFHSVDTTRMTTNVHCVSKRNEEHGRPADVKFPSLGQSAPFLLPSPLYFPLSPPFFSIRHPNPPSLTKRSKRERSEERTQKRRPPTCLTTHPL